MKLIRDEHDANVSVVACSSPCGVHISPFLIFKRVT